MENKLIYLMLLVVIVFFTESTISGQSLQQSKKEACWRTGVCMLFYERWVIREHERTEQLRKDFDISLDYLNQCQGGSCTCHSSAVDPCEDRVRILGMQLLGCQGNAWSTCSVWDFYSMIGNGSFWLEDRLPINNDVMDWLRLKRESATLNKCQAVCNLGNLSKLLSAQITGETPTSFAATSGLSASNAGSGVTETTLDNTNSVTGPGGVVTPTEEPRNARTIYLSPVVTISEESSSAISSPIKDSAGKAKPIRESGNEGSNTSSTYPVNVTRNETTVTASTTVTPGTTASSTTMQATTTPATLPTSSSSVTFSPSPSGTTKMGTRTTRILPITSPRNPVLNPRMCFCNGNGRLTFCEEFEQLCKNLPNYSDHHCSCKVRCKPIGYVDTKYANCVEPSYMFRTLMGG